MKLIIVMMMSLFLVSCASVGDFEDLAQPLCLENEESARYLLENERPFVIDLNVHNELIGGCE